MPGTVQDVSKVEPQQTTASVGVLESDLIAFDDSPGALRQFLVKYSGLQIRDRGLMWSDPQSLVIEKQEKIQHTDARMQYYGVSGLAHENVFARRQRERLEMSETAKDNVMKREQENERRHKEAIAKRDERISTVTHQRDVAQGEVAARQNAIYLLQKQRTVFLIGLILETTAGVVDVLVHVL